jgi:integrase
MSRRALPKGIRRKGQHWQAYIRVQKQLYTKVFPDGTPFATMLDWRARHKARVPSKNTLAADAQTYLATVRHLPDVKNRVLYLQRWIDVLGQDRRRHTITSAELDGILSKWLLTLSPTTVRHHRSALLALWKTLDGKDAPNPVKDTIRPADRPPQMRAVPLTTVWQVLSYLRPSQTRARLLVILTTGLPHAQIMRLTPDDWDKVGHRLHVSARRKGKGAASRVLPLSSAATTAMKEFAKWNCWGKFSQSAMHSAVHRACDALKVPRWRPYDLRHRAGTMLYQETGDLSTTARLLGHAGTKTAQRYTQEAWAELDKHATAKVGAQLHRKLSALLKGARKHET